MHILSGKYFKRYEMKFDITVNDPLLEPFLPVIRRRHERSVLKELGIPGMGSSCYGDLSDRRIE